MKPLTTATRTAYITFMSAAAVVDVLLTVWLLTDVSDGLGVGFLVTGAWIAPVAVHVLVHAVANSTPVARSGPTLRS